MQMTIGELSRRTGMPMKAIREYEGMGLKEASDLGTADWASVLP